MSQSPLILEGADHAFYQRFLQSRRALVRDLERDVHAHPLPAPAPDRGDRPVLCGPVLRGPRRHAATRHGFFPASSTARSSPDGGHASRNPRILIELLFDLLPLRQMFASRAVDTPEALLHAVDRMLPMLRLFRHPDGTLAHFNGMGVTAADHLATLLTYDDMRSKPIRHAPHSGYERLEAGRSLAHRRCRPAAADEFFRGSLRELPRLRVLERARAHHRQLRPAAERRRSGRAGGALNRGAFDRGDGRRLLDALPVDCRDSGSSGASRAGSCRGSDRSRSPGRAR